MKKLVFVILLVAVAYWYFGIYRQRVDRLSFLQDAEAATSQYIKEIDGARNGDALISANLKLRDDDYKLRMAWRTLCKEDPNIAQTPLLPAEAELYARVKQNAREMQNPDFIFNLRRMTRQSVGQTLVTSEYPKTVMALSDFLLGLDLK